MRAHAIAAKLRSRSALGREEATAAVLRSTGELAALAETAARAAYQLLLNGRRAIRRARGPYYPLGPVDGKAAMRQ